ncbi:MAG: hypothetical protein R3Y68_07750 [Rikenellaceae bacterium]
MRQLLLLLLLATSVSSAEAKFKVVESSSKRAPEWHNGASEEFVITSSVSEISIEDAKRRAVEQIKVKFIESVAQNINYTSMSRIEQRSGDEESFSDDFKSILLLNSAKLPFISGISESKITDFYWAVSEDRSTDRCNYIYSIKYPLSHAEVNEAVQRFEEIDREKSQELEMLQDILNNLDCVDEIADGATKCEELEGYFFDSTRKSAAASLRKRYLSLYDRICIVTQYEELGSAYIALQIGDRELSTTRPPTARYDREMIQNLQITPFDGRFEVSYDPTYCDEQIPYTITLSVPVGNRRESHEITFTKSKSEQQRIQPDGVVTLTAQQIENLTLSNIQLNFNLLVEGLPANTPVTVESVTLRVPNLKDEIYCDRVAAKFVGDNRFALTALCSTTIATNGEKSNTTIKLLSGEITGYYGAEKRAFKSMFSRSYRCNW